MTQNSILSNFWQTSLHQKILLIAFPMILSNITTPLMGLVDTAVLGHMDGTHFLAGASVATLVITQLYWVCGFLRMSSTGLSAQAKGSQDQLQLNKSVFQSIFISLVIALILLAGQDAVLKLGLYFANANTQIESVMVEYFQTRIWGVPAAMANLALIGWLIGQQKAKQVLLIQVLGNLLNVLLNLWFVFGLELEVKGVALATVFTEYCMMLASFYVVLSVLEQPNLHKHWFSLQQLKPLLNLNGNTFIRNLVLQACIAFLIFNGVAYGATSAAINAILMQFFTLITLGLDGIAYAAEALIGEKKGLKDTQGIVEVNLHGLLWSNVLAVLYALIFWLWGMEIIQLLTDQTQLHKHMQDYFVFIYALPLVAHWCFFFDGVFVGLTRSKAMRDTMLLSAVLVYLPTFYFFSSLENKALWIAMLMFMCARGFSLGGYLVYLCRMQKLLV